MSTIAEPSASQLQPSPMNISGNIYDNHGHTYPVHLWAPDPPAPQMPTPTSHQHLSGLAKAGVFGIIALVVIAIVAGILTILPKPLRIAVILAALGWVVWAVATQPKSEERFVAPVTEQTVPHAELVKLPEVAAPPWLIHTQTITRHMSNYQHRAHLTAAIVIAALVAAIVVLLCTT